MTLSDRQDRLLASAFGAPMGDNEIRRAVKAFVDEALEGTVGAKPNVDTIVVEEFGVGIDHITKLTLTAFAVGTIPDNAALAFGAKFYTLPAGTILVPEITLVGSFTGAVSSTAQTPEVGVGSVVGSGAAATLSSTMEDYMDGGAAGGIGGDSTAPDVNGGAMYKSSAITNPVVVKTTGGKARDLFLNVAATWADVTAAGALTFTGVITVRWRKVS